jgi:hypothetical protein
MALKDAYIMLHPSPQRRSVIVQSRTKQGLCSRREGRANKAAKKPTVGHGPPPTYAQIPRQLAAQPQLFLH